MEARAAGYEALTESGIGEVGISERERLSEFLEDLLGAY